MIVPLFREDFCFEPVQHGCEHDARLPALAGGQHPKCLEAARKRELAATKQAQVAKIEVATQALEAAARDTARAAG